MESPLDRTAWAAAIEATIRENGLKACYIRPLIYRGYSALGVNPLPCPVDVAIMVWEWEAYLGPDAQEKGVDVLRQLVEPHGAEHVSGAGQVERELRERVLIKMEAILDGYAEGIALDHGGFMSEGSGQNLFLVRGGIIYTPSVTASILPGITRDSIITIAAEPRDTRSAKRCCPARDALPGRRSILRRYRRRGHAHPLDRQARRRHGHARTGHFRNTAGTFFDILNGDVPDTHGWLTWVYPDEAHLRETRRARRTIAARGSGDSTPGLTHLPAPRRRPSRADDPRDGGLRRIM